jgi:hypothetical protein
MNIKMNIDTSKLSIKLRDAKKVVNTAMPQIHQEFVKNTPMKTGNARSKTTVNGKVISASYPYASVLNDGRSFRDGQMRGSVQAPKGMVEPTKKFAMALIKRLTQALGK